MSRRGMRPALVIALALLLSVATSCKDAGEDEATSLRAEREKLEALRDELEADYSEQKQRGEKFLREFKELIAESRDLEKTLRYGDEAYGKLKKSYEQSMKKLETELQEVKQERAQALLYLRKVHDWVGFSIKEPTEKKPRDYFVDADLIRARIQKELERLHDVYVLELPADKYTFHHTGGVLRERKGDKVVVEYIPKGAIPTESTLEGMFHYYEHVRKRMMSDISRLANR